MPLPQDRQTHRQTIGAILLVLLDPALFDLRSEQAMDAALGQGQPLCDLAELHAGRRLDEKLDDREAAFGRNMGHVLSGSPLPVPAIDR